LIEYSNLIAKEIQFWAYSKVMDIRGRKHRQDQPGAGGGFHTVNRIRTVFLE